MMSSASLMRQPSQDDSSHLGSSETNALIHAVLQLSRERGLAVHHAPPYSAPPRPAGRLVRGAVLAALVLAFGGGSYWLGARGTQPGASVAASTTVDATAAISPATAAGVLAAAGIAQPAGAAQGVDPALVQAVVNALAQAQAPKPEAQAKPVKPAPAVVAVRPPAPAAPQPRPAAPAPVAKAAPAAAVVAQAPVRDNKDDGVGVNVDLGNLGAAAPVARAPAPAPQVRTAAPAPAPAAAAAPAAEFSVVGVLDGMVLVQQGRRVSPVAVGQALPDGKVLHSTDAGSGKFQASKP